MELTAEKIIAAFAVTFLLTACAMILGAIFKGIEWVIGRILKGGHR